MCSALKCKRGGEEGEFHESCCSKAPVVMCTYKELKSSWNSKMPERYLYYFENAFSFLRHLTSEDAKGLMKQSLNP